MADILTAPVANIMKNTEQQIESVRCNTNFMKNVTSAKLEHKFWPLKKVLSNMAEGVEYLKKFGKFALSTIKDIIVAVDLGSSGETKREPPSLEDIQNKIGKDGENVEKYLKEKSNKFCDDLKKQRDLACETMFTMLQKECFQFGPLKMGFMSPISQVLCIKPCGLEKRTPNGLGTTTKGYMFYLGRLSKDSIVNVLYILKHPKKLFYITGKSFSFIKDVIERFIQIVDILIGLANFISAILFFRVAYGARTYQKSYLEEDKFDNIYITSYFKVIDARRWLQKRPKLLPLKKEERKDFKELFSLKLSKQEKNRMIMGCASRIPIFLLIGCLAYIDFVLFTVSNEEENPLIKFVQNEVFCFKPVGNRCIVCGKRKKCATAKCPYKGCIASYCDECWIDIRKKCYICTRWDISGEASDSGTN
ncbi:DgyrCDS3489 [Dimorphilus gyrociliatus]|uniref:DgyrCDS3489 n=1 Tax=Dimorphilus gyrociliatus TaxID=2664684 RepID=A0A7I8VF69_9ANNE|nr:DgyrCDS3489 [Dimorphilus gyrociliatus]